MERALGGRRQFYRSDRDGATRQADQDARARLKRQHDYGGCMFSIRHMSVLHAPDSFLAFSFRVSEGGK